MVDPGERLMVKLEEKTGKTAEEYVAMAKVKGFDNSETSWSMLMQWLKGDEVGLGHGYAMAVTHHIQEVFGLKR